MPNTIHFWLSRPADPRAWLATLLLSKSGDIETNPGPTWTCELCRKQIYRNHISLRCNSEATHWVHRTCSGLKMEDYNNDWRCRLHPPIRLTARLNSPPPTQPIRQPPTSQQQRPNSAQKSKQTLRVIQININGLRSKIAELEELASRCEADVITVQETKLKASHKTPKLQQFTPIRQDRTHKEGGGLLTCVKNNITFTPLNIPVRLNQRKTEIQISKIHLSNKKALHIVNLYIPPRCTTDPDHRTEDEDIENCLEHVTRLPNSILTGDVNAHAPLWHSPLVDHRGQLIEGIIMNSDHHTLNTDTPTRVPANNNQQPTSPDITTVTAELHRRCKWETITALTSDHLPIRTTINTKSNFRIVQHRHTYTNYNKADWSKFTEEIELNLHNIPDPTNVHAANRIITNLIKSADKHCIPKGKIKNQHKLLPEEIRAKIDIRDQMRTDDATDPRLDELNNEITTDIGNHKALLWRNHIEDDWDHRTNQHVLWKTMNGLSNKKESARNNTTVSFRHKIATTATEKATMFNKQFTNCTPHRTNRQIQVHRQNHQEIAKS